MLYNNYFSSQTQIFERYNNYFNTNIKHFWVKQVKLNDFIEVILRQFMQKS